MPEDSRRYTGLERADGLLTKSLRRRKLLERLSDARILALWPEAVGPIVSAETARGVMPGGLLCVVTADSICSHQLQSQAATSSPNSTVWPARRPFGGFAFGWAR